LSQHKPTIARSFPYFIYSRIFQRSTTKLNITIKTAIQKSNRVIKMADRHVQG